MSQNTGPILDNIYKLKTWLKYVNNLEHYSKAELHDAFQKKTYTNITKRGMGVLMTKLDYKTITVRNGKEFYSAWRKHVNPVPQRFTVCPTCHGRGMVTTDLQPYEPSE